MKLINNRYNFEIDFTNNQNHLLVIENSKEYLRVLQELYYEIEKGQESDFVLSDNLETLSICKNVVFLHNYIDLEINNKKILTEVNALILSKLKNIDIVEEISTINKCIFDINDKVLDDLDFEVSYNEDFTIDSLIKYCAYKICEENAMIEKIYSYVKIFSQLKKSKIVIFSGLMQILSMQELESLIKQINYIGLNCILIEPYEKYKLVNVSRMIVDEDLCEI